jgi:transposase-like protein
MDEYIEMKVTAGQYCPLCKEDGGLFYYERKTGSFYLCENCLNSFTKEEYSKLIKDEQ